ncbi:TPA: hypothetical protein ACXJN2_001587 [Serratia marcescens]
MIITNFLMMNQSTDAIVRAIESLRPTADYVKDYIFPVTLAFGSALLGGLSAVYINKKQDQQKVTRDNLVTSIELVALAQDCLSSLVSIKTNYLNIDSDDPLTRARNFPTIISTFEEVKFNTGSLYFIRPIPTENKKILESIIWITKYRILRMKVKIPPAEKLRRTWRNSVRIGAMFGNYNQVMGLLAYRNRVSEEVKEIVSSHKDGIKPDDAQEILGDKLCGGYVDITQSCVSLIDHLIIEFHHFLLEFPSIATSNIKLSRVREWGGVPSYENKQEAYLNCLKPIIKPDYSKFFPYTGMSKEQAEKHYTFGSWFD